MIQLLQFFERCKVTGVRECRIKAVCRRFHVAVFFSGISISVFICLSAFLGGRIGCHQHTHIDSDLSYIRELFNIHEPAVAGPELLHFCKILCGGSLVIADCQRTVQIQYVRFGSKLRPCSAAVIGQFLPYSEHAHGFDREHGYFFSEFLYEIAIRCKCCPEENAPYLLVFDIFIQLVKDRIQICALRKTYLQYVFGTVIEYLRMYSFKTVQIFICVLKRRISASAEPDRDNERKSEHKRYQYLFHKVSSFRG